MSTKFPDVASSPTTTIGATVFEMPGTETVVDFVCALRLSSVVDSVLLLGSLPEREVSWCDVIGL